MFKRESKARQLQIDGYESAAVQYSQQVEGSHVRPVRPQPMRHILYFRAPPAVDALVGIAHDKKRRGGACRVLAQQLQETVLRCICVLEFVHEHVPKSAAQFVQHVRRAFKEVDRVGL